MQSALGPRLSSSMCSPDLHIRQVFTTVWLKNVFGKFTCIPCVTLANTNRFDDKSALQYEFSNAFANRRTLPVLLGTLDELDKNMHDEGNYCVKTRTLTYTVLTCRRSTNWGPQLVGAMSCLMPYQTSLSTLVVMMSLKFPPREPTSLCTIISSCGAFSDAVKLPCNPVASIQTARDISMHD